MILDDAGEERGGFNRHRGLRGVEQVGGAKDSLVRGSIVAQDPGNLLLADVSYNGVTGSVPA